MDRKQLLDNIKYIELRLLNKGSKTNQGDYQSTQKGQGMIFSEVRNYQYGDDIRNIDWNVTARFKETYVKVFEEEKDKNILLFIDISSSGLIGYQNDFIKKKMIEIAAIVMFSAQKISLNIGAMLFSDKMEMYFPPKKGKSHLLKILNYLLDNNHLNKKTSLMEPLKWYRTNFSKNATIILMSDFKSKQNYFNELKYLASKHELNLLKLNNMYEGHLPKVGVVEMFNPETGRSEWINTNSRSTREEYRKIFESLDDSLNRFCLKNKIKLNQIDMTKDVFHQINRLLKV